MTAPGPSPRHVYALRVATAVRAGLATVLPFYAAMALGWPSLLWAALGGWLGSLADPGGRPRPRLVAIAGFAGGGALAVTLGLLAAPLPVLAAGVLAAVVFAASMLRAHGQTARAIGTVLAITAAIATSMRAPTPPVIAGLLFAAGVLGPMLLSSIVWGGPPAPRAEPAPPIPHDTVIRHATCVVIAALVAFVIGHALSPEHASWVTVTTVAVLQPYPAATIERAVERGLGTLAGSLVVVAITWLVHSPHALGVLMFAFATASVLVRARSYRLFVAFLTPVFVLVAEHLTSDWAIVATRLLDVAIGGALAVIATYAEHRAMLLRWRSGRCSSSSATST